MTLLLRPLRSADVSAMTQIIIDVSSEAGVVDLSYKPNEPDIVDFYAKFSKPGTRYWVVEDTRSGTLLGGVGYCPLVGSHPNEGIAELQKLYLSPASRGLGIGKALLSHALDELVLEGYREGYLETAPEWKTAIAMYEAMGFVSLPQRRGCTNNPPALSVWMSKTLPAASRQESRTYERDMQCA